MVGNTVTVHGLTTSAANDIGAMRRAWPRVSIEESVGETAETLIGVHDSFYHDLFARQVLLRSSLHAKGCVFWGIEDGF